MDISKEICGHGHCDYAKGRTTGFIAWAGGFGIIASIIGLLALFWYSIKPTVTLILDGFAALFFLAGGIVSNIFTWPHDMSGISLPGL